MSRKFIAGADYEPDPVLVHSWREAVVIVSLFMIFLVWTVGVSFALGREESYLPDGAESPAMVWGMPSWVFYGVFLPWMMVNLVGVWFCFFFMQDDDLEAVDRDLPRDHEADKAAVKSTDKEVG